MGEVRAAKRTGEREGGHVETDVAFQLLRVKLEKEEEEAEEEHRSPLGWKLPLAQLVK